MGVVFYVVVALLIILLLILLALVHAGYFYALRIRTSIPASAPRRIAYKLYKGPYSKSARLGYGHLMKLAPNSKAVAIYYDDPELVPSSDLRCIIGCYLPPETSKTRQDILLEAGYCVWTLSECSNAVITEFPYRSMLSLIVAPKIVYPALKKYFKINGFKAGPIVEVCVEDCIRYIAPLENQEGFYVPEVAKPVEESKKEQ